MDDAAALQVYQTILMIPFNKILLELKGITIMIATTF